jgi:hypothetical protein
MQTGSRSYLNTLLADKKEQVRYAADASEKRKRETGALNHYNAEAMLQGGVLVKEDKYIAEQKVLEDYTTNTNNS